MLDGHSTLHDALAGRARPDTSSAIDAYWVPAAEHGMNARTFTARVIASTGAMWQQRSAIGAMSDRLHGVARRRVLPMLDEARTRR